MRRVLVVVTLLSVSVLVGLVADGIGPPAVARPPAPLGPQADSARFVLNFPIHPEHNGDTYFGQVVYCGVATLSEPFRLDVVATAPPNLTVPEDPSSPYESGHDGSGWLDVKLQESAGSEGQEAYRVPTNDSLAFGLTLGGRPNADQMVRITSLPLGDVDGGGMPFRGVASVLAQPGATDAFVGDGRDDNYCVTVGIDGGPPAELEFPEPEFQEGEISTTLPVPDDWVVVSDGDGSDGGVLAGFPH